MKTRPIITGQYHLHGYSVLVDGQPEYSAGNSGQDSGAIVDPRLGLPLRTLRSFCIRTAREIASELGGRYAGSERTNP